jgi:AcrR family transcriptional regulator
MAAPGRPALERPSARADAGAPRRRVGRPPKLDREMIARAAHEVGLRDLTMRAVADRLGVSVPGLYHHIAGKSDLMRLAAEYSASRTELPEDRGQHWAVWLYEWAQYNRDAFTRQPELLTQFIEGAIGAERMVDTHEAVLTRLVAERFSIPEAQRAYATISEFAVGAAVAAIRERRAAAEGRPAIAEVHRVLAMSDPDEYPHVRQMVAGGTAGPRDGFHEGLLLILRGICEARGERWQAVRARLRRLA